MLSIVFKNRESGEIWIKEDNGYLCLNSDGSIFHWKQDYGGYWYYKDVSNHWIATIDEQVEQCPICKGSKVNLEIVDHDDNGDTVWENQICWKCKGHGSLLVD